MAVVAIETLEGCGVATVAVVHENPIAEQVVAVDAPSPAQQERITMADWVVATVH